MPDLAPNGQPLMTSTPADEEIGTCVLCESTTEDGRDVELTAHDEARDAFGPIVGTHYVCDDCLATRRAAMDDETLWAALDAIAEAAGLDESLHPLAIAERVAAMSKERDALREGRG